MIRPVWLFVVFLFALGACTQRMVCPAYQSAFIYDKEALRKKFSYFKEDSTPKVFTASKNKYLVAEPTTYRKKIRSIQTVPMKVIPVSVPDSIANPNGDSVILADLDRAARSIIDSTFIVDIPRDSVAKTKDDSVYVITKDKELRLLKYDMPDSLFYDEGLGKYVPEKPKYYVSDVRYNSDEDNYMWYLRKNLVLPDVRLAKLEKNPDAGSSKSSKKKQRRGIKGFFKDLFKKKEAPKVDSATLKKPKEEFDFVTEADTLSQAEIPQPGQVQRTSVDKKGDRESRRRKKEEKRKEEDLAIPQAVEEKDKKKEEDVEDGF